MFDMNTKILSDVSHYSCSLVRDPYAMQYLVCLHDFNTPEIPDGYTLKEIEDMINFLGRVKESLRSRNTAIGTYPLYTNAIE